MDSNAHSLVRALICGLAVLFIIAFRSFRLKNKVLTTVLQYVVSMAAILLIVYLIGTMIQLGGDKPCRDIFLNYTVVFVIVDIVIWSKQKRP